MEKKYLLIAFLGVILTALIILSIGNGNKKAIESCVSGGNTQEFCERNVR